MPFRTPRKNVANSPSTPQRKTGIPLSAVSMKPEHRMAKRTSRRRTQRSRIARPKQQTTYAHFGGDAVWAKVPKQGGLVNIMMALCEDGAEGLVPTTIHIQHPATNVCEGMMALVSNATGDDDTLTEFPSVFNDIVADINAASEWSLCHFDEYCGGLEPSGEVIVESVSDRIAVSVDLDGTANVQIPYDPTRYGNLYRAAVEVATSSP